MLAMLAEDSAQVIARQHEDKRKKRGMNNSPYIVEYNQWIAGCLSV
ncbi:hypothetical protein yrohd0001_27720 [Yersinia rohdei ATCC 43380]|nr:hypothetical protein yrohd0001_27720 [Yersinia rohdei ATCC 43380]